MRLARPRYGSDAAALGEAAAAWGDLGPRIAGVHYAYLDDVDRAEGACIGHFADHVSPATRATIHDADRIMPFANLEHPRGTRKRHGIEGARAPKKRRGQPMGGGSTGPGTTTRSTTTITVPASVPAGRAAATRKPPAPGGPHRSRAVSAKDIAVGQIRIPIGETKSILPPGREYLTVRLRGRELICRWDPRYGTDRERSGIIRVGRAAAAELLEAGEMLGVRVSEGVVELR